MVRKMGIVLSMLMVLVLLTGAIGSTVRADEPELQATGLLSPTPEQEQWLRENVPVVQTTHLNSLALQRINAERMEKGLVELSAADIDLAQPGDENTLVTATDSLQSTETDVNLAAILPSAVDNSLSPAFPPIGNQGSIGSCASWATTYYQFTYETNLALGRNASGGNSSVIFSPKWTYNMINGGGDNGSGFADAYALEMKNGAATWQDFPYDSNYLAWCLNPAAWSRAVNYRAQKVAQLYNSDVDTLINDVKTQLANGHVVVTATYVYSWVQTTIANDPSTADDDAFVGQRIASYAANTDQGGHGMTIVGYNDNIWTDLNGNGRVDAGEKGAFKVANSWGPNDWNKGFRWVAYDAMRPVSSALPVSSRSSRGIFWPGNMFVLTVAPYSPSLKAEVTLNTAKRGQLAVTLGVGDIPSTVPSTTWASKAAYYCGGNYAFNGTSTAVDGTFYFDFSDLAKSVSGAKRWFVGISDSSTGSPATIKSFKLYLSTASGDTLVATSSNVPQIVDGGKIYAWVDYTYNPADLPPFALIRASPTSGQAPLTVIFDGSGSGTFSGQIQSYSWDFGDGSDLATGPVLSHTYLSKGTYTAILTVTNDKGMTGTNQIVVNASGANEPPVLASIGNKTVKAGETLAFVLSATDPDGDALSYSAKSLPAGANFNTSSHSFSWTPATSQVGNYPNVYFQVSDGKLIDSENITITVANANRAPVLASIGYKTVVAGQTLSFKISASDPDGDTLTYKAANLPAGASFNTSTQTFTWTPAVSQAGTYSYVYFQVSDGKLTDYEYVKITVTKANQPPVLAAIGNKTILAGKTLTFMISATDPDNNTLTYSASGLPTGAGFNAATRTFTWTPATSQAGIYTDVRFQVGDGSLIDYENINITVTKSNQPPVLATIGNRTATVGQTLSFTISATDPDGDALTYLATSLPAGAIFNAATRTFTWTPVATQIGTYGNIYFRVSDGSLTDYEYIAITVNQVTLTGQVSGSVKDSATGAGISGATVSVGTLRASTGAAGTYTITNVPAGTYTMNTQASGYPGVSQTVTVAAGQTATADFNLTASTAGIMWVDSITFIPGVSNLTVKVKVVNPDPVASAQVMIKVYYNSSTSKLYQSSTGADGIATFVVSPAVNGSYTVYVLSITQANNKWDSTRGMEVGSKVLSR